MSNNLDYKQAANVERRTWDRETYEAKVHSREQAEQQVGQSLDKGQSKARKKRNLLDEDEALEEEFIPAAAGSAGPEKSERAFLKARQRKVDIDSKVGMTSIVSAESSATSAVGEVKGGVTKTGVGWHCKVCDCFVKDSHTYLDHINGRKHQRNLGYSMRIEQNTKDQVQAMLAELTKQNEIKNVSSVDMETNFEDALRTRDEEAIQRKEERSRKREERKKKIHEVDDDEDDVEPEIDPAMAAMMGFSGFGGCNKK